MSLADGFIEFLNSELTGQVELWNPFHKMRCDSHRTGQELMDKKGPAFVVAAGLAMRSI